MGDESGDEHDEPRTNGGVAPMPVDPPETAREFEQELANLVKRASGNGVDVTGGWTVEEGDGSNYDLGVEIFPVRRE